MPKLHDGFAEETRKEILSLRGSCLARLGIYDLAVADLRAARAISQRLGDRPGELNYLFFIGSISWAQDIYSDAIIAYQQALGLARQLGNQIREGQLLANLGSVCQAVGDYEAARRYLQSAWQTFITIPGNEEHKSNILARLGSLHATQGDFSAAIQSYNEALKYEARSQTPTYQASYYNALADLYLKTNEYARASSLIEQALTLTRKSAELEPHLIALNLAGELNFRTGKVQKAAEIYRELSQGAQQGNNPHHLWKAYTGLAAVCRKRGRLEDARSFYQQAVELIEDVRVRLGSDLSREGFFQDKLQTYQNYLVVLMSLHRKLPAAGYDRAAFQLSERARAMMDTLGTTARNLDQNVETDLKAERREIQARFSQAESQYRKSAGQSDDAAKLKSLEEELKKAAEAMSDWQRRVRLRNPHLADLRFPEPLTLTDVQQLLGNN
ncbi:MAG: tetratricopeptide repeat protein [Acidobacteriota bacterium]|nr:tetratricopeptide repeat protein [Acidobacteriota bacterium]